jgi:TatD DNase family protein
VTVHSRGAEALTIERLEAAGISAILHWYTGPPRLVDRALAAGMYFSVNPAMLRSAKGRAIVALLPKSRVLTESDAPFARTCGRSTTPMDMPQLVAAIAREWSADSDYARRCVYENMTALYAATVGSNA